jgi:hypothetical protein
MERVTFQKNKNFNLIKLLKSNFSSKLPTLDLDTSVNKENDCMDILVEQTFQVNLTINYHVAHSEYEINIKDLMNQVNIKVNLKTDYLIHEKVS